MGGFSASVQQDLNQTPPPPPNAPIGNMGRDVMQGIAGKGGANTPPPPQATAQPAVMPQEGGGKGQQNYEQRPSYAPFEPNYAPPDGTRGGKGASTNSATSGQPRMGQPNRYANTIPQWDNASQQLGSAQRGGKGKGG